MTVSGSNGIIYNSHILHLLAMLDGCLQYNHCNNIEIYTNLIATNVFLKYNNNMGDVPWLLAIACAPISLHNESSIHAFLSTIIILQCHELWCQNTTIIIILYIYTVADLINAPL